MKRPTLIITLGILLLVGAAGYVLMRKGAIEDTWYRYQLSRSQDAPKMQWCGADENCVVVQDSWCGTVLSVNRKSKEEWIKQNTKDAERGREERWTCKPSSAVYKNLNNFSAECEQGACVAKFLDVSLDPVCGNGVCESGENDCGSGQITPGCTGDCPVRQTCQPLYCPQDCQKKLAVDDLTIIKTFMERWPLLQRAIPFRPLPDVTEWPTVTDIQFIGNNRLLVAFDDGHAALAGLFAFDQIDQIIYETVFKDYSYSLDEWEDIRRRFGEPLLPARTYSRSVLRNGKVVRFPDWTLIPENTLIMK